MADAPDNAPVTWDSKVDKFDKRLSLVRRQFWKETQVKPRTNWELETRDVSLYEFYSKYYLEKSRICRPSRLVALMVTPGLSADCACVAHDRHEVYARTCVVAFWRHMPTLERYKLADRLDEPQKDKRRYGGSVFNEPYVHAAGEPSLLDRHLGVYDLELQFHDRKLSEMHLDAEHDRWQVYERKRGTWKYGWPMALMEMLVDPMLMAWVPAWVREQYERRNPFFRPCLRQALDSCKDECMKPRRKRDAVAVAHDAEEIEETP